MGVDFSSGRQPVIRSDRGGHKTPAAPAKGIRPKGGRTAKAPSGPNPKTPGMRGSGVSTGISPPGKADGDVGSGGPKVRTGGIKKAL